MARPLHRLCWLAALLGGSTCSRTSGVPGHAESSASTASFDATVATRWMQVFYDIVKSNTGLTPPVASRAYGYAGVTLYESVVAGMPDYQSLAGQLNDFIGVPQPDGEVDFRAVANTALGEVIRGGIVPNINPDNVLLADDLEAAINIELAFEVDATVLQRSTDLGIAIAAAILDWAGHDGFIRFDDCSYTPPVGPGLWAALPGQTALQPCWDLLRPFVLVPASGCSPPSHPPFSEVVGSAFRDEAEEVYATTGDAGFDLTLEQGNIAYFWSDDAGATGTTAGHWVSIATQVCATGGESPAFAAVAHAKLGIAMADAFIACWQAKYLYNLERPITCIQRVIDGNWDPLLSTPAFPEYTSGHSVLPGAATTVLTDTLGPRTFTDNTHALHNDTVGAGGIVPLARSFTDFDQAAREAADSRLFGGIHFRSAIDNGLSHGVCVGNEVLSLRFLRP